MHRKLIAVCVVLLAAFILAAGCTGTDTQGTNPTASPTAQPESTANPDFSLTPGTTDPFSDGQEVAVQVVRDSNKPDITVTFAGGKGREQISDITVILYREEDGAIETYSFGKEPRTGAEHVFTGSMVPTMKDRIKATARYYNGDVVVFSDAVYAYKERA
jgi:hypothetical protein